jgi:GNAT superfamily N-acetyltransferase
LNPGITLRPFRRADREQLTGLVNAHAGAVVPGASASVSTVLSQLERQPGEAITDPWVSERATLVAEQRERVVAAAHLLRYFPDERAGAAYRDVGEIRWLLFNPEAPRGNPCWPGAEPAAARLMDACIGQLERWGVARQHAGGELPVPGVYGVPGQWPHIRAIYRHAGFRHTGHTEAVYLALVADLPTVSVPPFGGMTLRRTVGMNGTRLSAMLDDEVAGFIEVEMLGDAERLPRFGSWADVGNLRVSEPYRRRGVATWLLGQAARWLRLARVERLLDYAILDGAARQESEEHGQGQASAESASAGYQTFLAASGFTELTRTQRGWTRAPEQPAGAAGSGGGERRAGGGGTGRG